MPIDDTPESTNDSALKETDFGDEIPDDSTASNLDDFPLVSYTVAALMDVEFCSQAENFVQMADNAGNIDAEHNYTVVALEDQIPQKSNWITVTTKIIFQKKYSFGNFK